MACHASSVCRFRLLIQYMESLYDSNTDEPLWKAVLFSFLMLFTILAGGLIISVTRWSQGRVEIKVRTQLMSAIYKKVSVKMSCI